MVVLLACPCISFVWVCIHSAGLGSHVRFDTASILENLC